MSETEFTLLLWGLLIAFIVGRNYYRKHQQKEKEEKYLKGVKTLRKMMLAKNDNEFSRASLEMNNQINEKNKLHFKSVDAAFEYMEKFFSNYKIEKKSLYHGKITSLNKKKDTAHVKVLCLINNKTDYAIVTAVKSNDLEKDLKKGDFVYSIGGNDGADWYYENKNKIGQFSSPDPRDFEAKLGLILLNYCDIEKNKIY